MRLKILLLLALAVVWQPAQGAKPQVAFDRFIIKFRAPVAADRASPVALQRLPGTLGVSARVQRPLANGAFVVRMSQSRRYGQWLGVMAQLVREPEIAYVEPDVPVEPTSDPLSPDQWYLNRPLSGINAPGAWAYSTGVGAVIAILDSGLRPHADLLDNTLPGFDFISDPFVANDGDGRDADASDPGDGVSAGACGGGLPQEDRYSSWHGTHVAGIAAASANGYGILGVAHGAGLLPVRVLGRCGGFTSDIVDAIYWAAGLTVPGVPDNPTPADVINMSLSATVTGSCGQAYADAVAAARAAGVAVVTSAGNRAADATDYAPGNCPGVINVAAVDRNGGRAYYSNYGAPVAIAAPGGDTILDPGQNGILSTLDSGLWWPEGDTFGVYQGTSMAAPQVSAALALMRGARPLASVAELEQTLIATARDFAADCIGCGAGLLDAEESLKRILGLTVAASVADLQLRLLGNSGRYLDAGDGTGTIGYLVVVENAGPDPARELRLALQLPAQTVLESLSVAAGSQCDFVTLRCEWPQQAPDTTLTFGLVVRTGNPDKMDFSAQISALEQDPDVSNNYASARFGGAIGWGWIVLLGLMCVLRWRGCRAAASDPATAVNGAA
ncbi:MAG: S8 family serine peptidase [Pseudomonadota bacterium]|nr:S8 family serine peptidase [Pseudomonadota bacterium]